VPVFQWKGRTRDGHEISGKINARSKEDLTSRLRAQGITLTSAGESASSSEPPDPDRIVAQVTPVSAVPDRTPHPFRGFIVMIGLIVLAVAIGAMAPIVICKCDRSAGRVTCTIDDRILGFVPMRHQSLAGVVSVDTETERWLESRGSSKIERSKTRIVLHDARGATIRPFGWDQNGTLGATTDAMEHDIDVFLSESRQTSVAFWQGQWVPLLMPAILLFLALMMLVLIGISLNPRATSAFYNGVDNLAKSADRRRKLHHS
jgi:hypothetical protein